jgi:hypothetical protein
LKAALKVAVISAGYAFFAATGVFAQVTTKLCRQDVTYEIKAPKADVPEEARPLLGVWHGAWDNLLCAAVVVEEVEANGSATIVYVNGVGLGASGVSGILCKGGSWVTLMKETHDANQARTS